MKKYSFLTFFIISIGTAILGQGLRAQTNCEKALIAAENLYQSGQLYDIPDRLEQCMESGFNFQEKQSAYRLLSLTYLNINQEEKAKNALHKLLRLNPDYVITKEKDPAELYNLYLQFKVDPVFYMGLRGGAVISRPFILQERSSSSLQPGSDKFYEPFYGFNFGGDMALPLFKHLLLEFSPSYTRSSYLFQSLYLTDGFAQTAAVPQVQEVAGQETYHTLVLPLGLNYRIPARQGKLNYSIGVGVGASFLLASSYTDLNRVNRQIFTEEISISRVKTTPYRRDVNVLARLEVGLEYKYRGYFWGARMGFSAPMLNFTKYPSQQEMFLNTMSTNFGWLDDDFVLANGYFSVFVRKPLYKFL